jgi:CDP-diacylglycerol--glycerol-3-phosphate 3-phosphatidyltransferase
MVGPMARPLVTANQVTLARLALLPIGSWLMYQDLRGQVFALIFMTLVGCTDFVDGWLARKYGPTVLGGLMDPIADKVFIVVVFLPFVDLGWMRPWLVGLLFLREFLVTGLRSSYERRGMKLRTTFLAKVKTWAQMGGAGVLFLMQVSPPRLMMILLLCGGLLPLLFLGIRFLVRRYFWTGALVFSGWFLAVLACYALWGQRVASEFLMLAMLAVTWISGGEYLSKAISMLAQKPLDRSDFVRISGAVLLPILGVAAQAETGLPALPLIATMSLEMAVGGLDNLLCHHQAQSGSLAWSLRVGLVSVFLGLAIAAAQPGSPLPGAGLSGATLATLACLISLIGTVWEFVRGRHYYLDKRLQEKPLDL